MSIETSAVQANVTGTSFSVNVTAANLSEDLLEKDFRVLDRTNEIVLDNVYWSKASVNSLSYSGPLLDGVDVEIRRDTPIERYQVVAFSNRFDPTVYNTEVDNILRALYEFNLFTAEQVNEFNVEPLDQEYGVAWANDNARSRVASRLYEKIETLAPIDSPTFTGTPSAPSPVLTDNTTRLATTQFVNSFVAQQNSTQNTALIATILELVFPVGSVYTSMTNSANPNTILGFGSWTKIEGRILVGHDPNDGDFDVVKGIGGEKAVTLTTNTMPAHTHSISVVSSGLHSHANQGQYLGVVATGSPFSNEVPGFQTGTAFGASGRGTPTTQGGGTHTHTATAGSIGNGAAHNNMQPYIVAYIWQRVA
jgi:microcystin-dependent protein